MGRRAGLPKLLPLEPGKTIYKCRFTANGVRVTVTTGESDPSRAVEASERLYAEAKLGRPIKRTRRVSNSDSASIAVLSARYLAQVKASGKAPSYYRKQHMHFHAHFLPRWTRLSDLTSDEIERYATSRASELTNRGTKVQPPTIYKEMVTLSQFMRWCERHANGFEAPPFDRVKPVSAYESPDFSEEDMRALLAELPDRRKHPRRFAVREYHTVQWAQGMRPGEVGKLRWSDVDLEKRRITIRQRNDKAREKFDRIIAMADETHAVLSELASEPHIPAAFIFGQHDYRTSIELARTRAKLSYVTPHHLRHARLTELASKTQDVAALQYLAGHRNLSTTDRYVRSRAQRTEELLKTANSGTSNARGTRKRKQKRAGKK